MDKHPKKVTKNCQEVGFFIASLEFPASINPRRGDTADGTKRLWDAWEAQRFEIFSHRKISGFPRGVTKKKIRPGRLTWNLRIHPWKRKNIFQTIIFKFHVNLPGCTKTTQHPRKLTAKKPWKGTILKGKLRFPTINLWVFCLLVFGGVGEMSWNTVVFNMLLLGFHVYRR